MADDVSDFSRSMGIATSGLRAQAGRMRPAGGMDGREESIIAF